MFISKAQQSWREVARLLFRNPLKCSPCRRLQGKYISLQKSFIFRHFSHCEKFYSTIHQVNYLFCHLMWIYSLLRLISLHVNSDIHLPLRLDKDFIGSVNSFRGKKWDKVVKTGD